MIKTTVTTEKELQDFLAKNPSININNADIVLAVTSKSVVVGGKSETETFASEKRNQLSRWLGYCLSGRKRIEKWELTISENK